MFVNDQNPKVHFNNRYIYCRNIIVKTQNSGMFQYIGYLLGQECIINALSVYYALLVREINTFQCLYHS